MCHQITEIQLGTDTNRQLAEILVYVYIALLLGNYDCTSVNDTLQEQAIIFIPLFSYFCITHSFCHSFVGVMGDGFINVATEDLATIPESGALN